MIFLTIDGDHIDLADADRIHVGWRVIDTQKCWVIWADIGDVRHAIVSTGDNRQQAKFHCQALNQCKNNGDL